MAEAIVDFERGIRPDGLKDLPAGCKSFMDLISTEDMNQQLLTLLPEVSVGFCVGVVIAKG